MVVDPNPVCEAFVPGLKRLEDGTIQATVPAVSNCASELDPILSSESRKRKVAQNFPG